MDKVKYAVGLTLNLGNYNSARVDVGVEIKAEEGMDEAYEQASEYCLNKLTEEVEVLQSLKGVIK